MKNETVKDREAKTGKPDSIRNADGTNSRSDKHIATLSKQAAKLATKLTLPEEVPDTLIFHYPDGSTKTIAGDGVKAAAAYLNAIDLLK